MSINEGRRRTEVSGRAMNPGNHRALISDELLVRRCREGDEEAWETLIDKYRKVIYSIPLKHGLSADDAAEVFQEVFLALATELPRLREPRALLAWLIKVAASACVRRRKVNGRYAQTELDQVYIPDSVAMPIDMLEELQREQAVREALSEASKRCRELIAMLFYTTPPVPYEEIARRLGLAKGSIGFTRMQCLAQLRNKLAERGFA
jgi:RNA polymerase sigma factor (sigma-70 family)